ncbi:MAG: CotH kinase family protein [Eubacteriales bacterium]|nr:CotH kinase family protein [Eubacteriales bacterium]
MIKSKGFGVAAVLLMVAAALLVIFACVNPSFFSSLTGTPAPAYAAAMNKEELIDLQIIADEDEWASLLENATSEEYIPATVIINGEKLENVGIRAKGNSSLSTVARDETSDRYSFKIEFDHYISGQTWMGLDKLAVNNIYGDASYLKEYISYDIMDYVGVDAPLYAFTDISVNGETWGLYLAVEAIEDSYAKRVYGSNHGQIYKPESMNMDIGGQLPRAPNETGKSPQATKENEELPQNINPDRKGGFSDGGMSGMTSNAVSLQYTDDDISSYTAIFDNAVFDATDKDANRVIAALKKLSAGEDLAETVDVGAVLKYFAAHTVVVNLDSYVSNMGHNYYLYEKDGQLTILPWDYNLAFGGFQSGNASDVVNFPIDTPVSGVTLADRPLLGKLLEVEAYADLYHTYLQEIVTGYFHSGLFEQTVDAMDTLIAAYVEADATAFYSYDEYQTAVAELKELGLLRAQSIEGQLDGTIPGTTEGQKSALDALVDASGINLNALGGQGGGGGFGQGGGGGFAPNNAGFGPGGGDDFDPGGGGGFGRGGQGDGGGFAPIGGGFDDPNSNDRGEPPNFSAPEMESEMPQMQGERPEINNGSGNNSPGNSPPNASAEQPTDVQLKDAQPASTSTYDAAALPVLFGCAVLLSAGLLFVIFFKRRR